MDRGRILFSADHAAATVDATLAGARQAVFTAVCVDSRKACPGALFVALAGERTDGHRFVRDALIAGASGVLIASSSRTLVPQADTLATDFPQAALLTVSDALAALQALAADHRARLRGLTVIGITGSNGKTTTKELIGAVISAEQPTFVSHGNLNSDIGLALSIFGINTDHRFAVLEMGMNRIGEMRQLARMARPDLALITNIGTAHIGNIGSIEQIISEKKAICAEFSGAERLLIWEDEPCFERLADGVNGEVSGYGPRSTEGWHGFESHGLSGSKLHWRGRDIRLALPGEHSVRNALAAISTGLLYEVSEAAIASAIESVRPLFGRGEIIETNVSVIVDCYNANPESMQQALRFTMSVDTSGRRIAVLGAMKELGHHAAGAHQALITRALASGLDAVLLLGQEFAPGALASEDDRLYYCRSFDELVETFRALVEPGDLILIKGSRSLELERLVPYVTGERE